MVQSPIGNKRISESTLAIRVRNVSKSFPGVQALRKVSFVLETGEVHGLVGANGAGKSTFIRMLSGASTPDTGDIEVQGLPISFEDPRAQRDNGIAAIYQELTIIPEMSALSNVFLGEVPNRWFVVDRRGMEKRFNELAEWMGVKISPHATAKTLSVANQQMLEIMRAVHAEHDVIIMDEPTAPLGPFERSRLYDLIGRLKENNVSIIFISHDLDEVLRLCDRVSVMRDGQLIETRQSSGWTKDSLVKAMLGDIQIVAGRKREHGELKPLLRVQNLSLPGKVSGINFELGEGEVLGIAGLVGAGRTEVLRSVAGLEALSEGRMTIGGEDCAWPQSVREAIERGIALAPEDRKREGLVLSRSALCNLLLADIGSPRGGRSSRLPCDGQRRRCWPNKSALIPTVSTPMRFICLAAISRNLSSASGCTGGRASFFSTSRPAASIWCEAGNLSDHSRPERRRNGRHSGLFRPGGGRRAC